ncbi:MAG: hypothetical protein RLN88_02340 [Ekhidna sp.]|uniref:glycosyltransferase domain-containing protein n=1 Tax=Ekhidna sp. TaxID=2608089 RepID=UPI0032EEBADF
MKVITIATHTNHHLERLLASTRKFNIEIELLGEGRVYTAHDDKTKWTLEFLEKQDDDEIVLYTDGYDSAFLRDTKYIEEEFLKLDHPFVLGTEQNFNCDEPPISKFRYYMNYPRGKKPYRFLNAGGWIGRAGYVKGILKLIEKDGANDQDILNQFITTNRDKLKLDHDHRIFSCIAGRSGMEDHDYVLDANGMIKNTITGSHPAIIHAAGKNFYGMYKVTSKLDYFPEETFTEEEVKQYEKSQFWNRLTAKTTRDNYLFHFLLKLLVVLVVLSAVLAIFLS